MAPMESVSVRNAAFMLPNLASNVTFRTSRYLSHGAAGVGLRLFLVPKASGTSNAIHGE